MLNPDFRDMLSALNDAGAEYLIVGAFAMAAHGYTRSTGDIDVWIRPSAANARRVWQALGVFGAPVSDLTLDELEDPDLVYQIGVPPNRIDLLTGIDGVDFDTAWSRRRKVHLQGLEWSVLSKDDLLQNKRASGRPKDIADAHWLEQPASDDD